MKALSIRQPWAHAILHLGKRVENRDWAGCSYRGPILLHASKTLSLRDFHEDVTSILSIVKPEMGEPHRALLEPLAVHVHKTSGTWLRPSPTLPLGGIVGRARIVDIIRPGMQAGAPSTWQQSPNDSPWYAGCFALVLADVETLPFRPCRGSLGLFDVPDEMGMP